MSVKGIFASVVGVIVLIAVLVVSFGSFYTVDQGERAVVLRNGKVVQIAEPGLSFKTPMLESTSMISVRDNTIQLPMEAYSKDQQPASLKVSVTYRVPPDQVESLYGEYGSLANLQSRVIERRAPDAVKNVFGQFTAMSAIQDRQKLGVEVTDAVRKIMQDAPVQIVSVQVEEVGFSSAYEHSIEQRMLAQVQIETTRQQKQTAEIQAEIKVVQAKATADAQREQYQAEADGIKLRGDAFAQSIHARAKALSDNKNLVDLMAVEKWDGKLPATQVPGSSVPFINVK